MRHTPFVILGLALTLASGPVALSEQPSEPADPQSLRDLLTSVRLFPNPDPVCPDVWTTHGPVGGLINDVAVDPTDSSVVYAASYQASSKPSTAGPTGSRSTWGSTPRASPLIRSTPRPSMLRISRPACTRRPMAAKASPRPTPV
ncbi:MAG: hypothetical protein HC897_00840 [Thermoanaerobaculia bacterium]|nr:hypothetical protein [Thermoanaerobaculia bacterium]